MLPSQPNTETSPLDAYSQVVSGVADHLLPRVVRLEVGEQRAGRGPSGSGSAVVITPDGFLLTAAHVVDAHNTVTAEFTDGRVRRAEIVGRDPFQTLRSAAWTTRRLPSITPFSARPTRCVSGSWWSQLAVRSASQAA